MDRTIGAAAPIAQTGASAGADAVAVAVAVFVFIAILGPGLPVAIYFWMGEGADRRLADIKAWMIRHNAAVMAVLCLLIGAKLVGDAIAVLSA